MRLIKLITFLLLASCEGLTESFHPMLLDNNSSYEVVFHYARPHGPYAGDTLLPSEEPTFVSVAANTNRSVYLNINYKKFFKELPNDTLYVFALKRETLNNNKWDSISEKYLIEARYDISLYDLKNRKYVLEYPYDSGRGELKGYFNLAEVL